MDFSERPEETQFRSEVRTWLAGTLPALPWPEPPELEGKLPFWRQYQAELFKAGYAGLTWTKEYGGHQLGLFPPPSGR